MPRREKGARLLERKRKGRPSVWVIKDTGGYERSTGTSSRSEAETILAEHIASKFWPSGPTAADQLTIGQVLAIYAEDYAPSVADPARIGYAIDALDPFWGSLPVSAIKGETCRRYAKQRNRAADTVRRELGVLRSALNYCAGEGWLIGVPVVTLPDKPDVEERYLTRSQFALLLHCAGKLNIDGRQQLRRWMLVSVYTGTRKTASLALGIDTPRVDAGWIDTERGLIFRKGSQERATAKRRKPARCPQSLLVHARRWKELGARYACENYQGNRVRDIRKGWDHAADLAVEKAERLEIDSPERRLVTPHILKHTAITWAIQNGASLEDAAAFFSTSRETIERVYWHHSPYFQESAVSAIDNPVKLTKQGRNQGRAV
jgi:integrase